jgi:hypothetical protein
MYYELSQLKYVRPYTNKKRKGRIELKMCVFELLTAKSKQQKYIFLYRTFGL